MRLVGRVLQDGGAGAWAGAGPGDAAHVSPPSPHLLRCHDLPLLLPPCARQQPRALSQAGHLDILKWLRSEGCEWSHLACLDVESTEVRSWVAKQIVVVDDTTQPATGNLGRLPTTAFVPQ